MHRSVSILVALLLVGTMATVDVTAQGGSLLGLLPMAEEVGSGFLVTDERLRGLEDQATGFANAGEAAGLLAGWRWQENAFKVFQTAELTANGAPVETVDISLTRFDSAESAAAAMPYFLEDRAAVMAQREFTEPTMIGDETRAVHGFYNGAYDVTIYARTGPLLMRVSAASVVGSPSASPERIAQGIVDRAAGIWQPVEVVQTAEVAQSAGTLPASLPLDYADCFEIAGEGALEAAAMGERLAGDPAAMTALEGLGWQGGEYRQFACDPPPGRAGWVDISVHSFMEAGAAAEAVAIFAKSRSYGTNLEPVPTDGIGDASAALAGPGVNGMEHTLYLSSGPQLYAVTGVAPEGDPRSDVESIARALYDLRFGTASDVVVLPTPTPELVVQPTPAGPMPTIAPVPTATPIPTIAPVPTATPVPTLPPPTATLIPTATLPPVPTTIPVMIPTPTPALAAVPTATPTGPLPTPTSSSAAPTPTPRVIHLPTPAGG